MSRKGKLREPSKLSSLAEYELPQLPPVREITGAIARQRISKGISYLLPMDAPKNSIENVYSTNLRLVFKEPYLSDNGAYNENSLRASAKTHFRTRVGPPKKPGHKVDDPVCKLDTSEYLSKIQRSNARLRLSRKLKSRLYLKDETAAEELGIHKPSQHATVEVVNDLANATTALDIKGEVHPLTSRDTRSAKGLVPLEPMESKQGPSTPVIPISANVTQVDSNSNLNQVLSYEDINLMQEREPRKIPEDLKSPYLEEEKSKDIWLWLHDGKPQTGLDYLLEVCS